VVCALPGRLTLGTPTQAAAVSLRLADFSEGGFATRQPRQLAPEVSVNGVPGAVVARGGIPQTLRRRWNTKRRRSIFTGPIVRSPVAIPDQQD